MSTVLPLTRPSLGIPEIQAAVRVLSSPQLTQGPEVAAFETEFTTYHADRRPGELYSVATNACTSALYLTLKALGIGPGDEVITSALSWIATALAIRWTGATVIFADVDDYGLLDPEHVYEAVTPRTRAIVPVHLYGQVCDVDAFAHLAAAEDLDIVYDAAHAIEARSGDRPCAQYGTASCYSFHATKNITTAGEGGMMVTRRPEIADYVRKARCFGLTPGTRTCEQFGAKLNMTEVQAAVGRVQLRRIEERYLRRKLVWSMYQDALTIVRPINFEHGVRDALHLYAVSADRERAAAALERAGIGYGVHYRPIYDEPEFAGTKPKYAENTDRIGRRTISLPFFPEMTYEDVARVAKALEGIL
jgi:perosamine synthetase